MNKPINQGQPADLKLERYPAGVILTDIEKLKTRIRNPRIHSKRQIGQIAASIKRFGFVNPILVDHDCRIIAGHGRVEGAKLAGLTKVPTLLVSHLSEDEIRAYVIADNKLAENAGWDRELLALELQELSIEVEFDLTLTGFETAEIDILLKSLSGEPAEPPAAPQVDKSVPAVTRLGDLWLIGKHRLLCGDARDPEAFRHLMNGELAGVVFTDPPYNVRIDGHVSGLGKARHREFAMATGEMTPEQFTDFLRHVLQNLAINSRDGALHFICMDWRHVPELLGAATPVYTELKNLCVWVKTNGGMGSLYRSQHEFVFVYKNGGAPHINNVELGKHGRNRTNVWTYAGANAFSQTREADLVMHPTVKPIPMVADALLDVSNRGDVVLDCFAGSGTTLLAAQDTGRCGYGMEIDPHYVDLIISRFKETSDLPIRCGVTGQSWDEIAIARR